MYQILKQVSSSEADVTPAASRRPPLRGPNWCSPKPRDGRAPWDGGIADNAAVSQALALGADRVFVLPAGVACALDQPPRGVLASALHALSVLIEQRLIVEVAYLADRADLHVLPPLCPLGVASFDFHHGAELIDRARRATRAWLAEGGTRRPRPERFLSLHHHRSASQADFDRASSKSA